MRKLAILLPIIGILIISAVAIIYAPASDAADPTFTDPDNNKITYTLHESATGTSADMTWKRANNQSITVKASITVDGKDYPVTKIVIPSGANKTLVSLTIMPNEHLDLSAGQFSGFTKLSTVVLGEGIQTIPSNFLNGCTVLSSVSLPSTVKTIGNGAFMNCSKLTSLTFPDNLETIGDQAFQATGLKSVVFDDKLKSIGSNAFYKCKSLTAVTINEALEYVGQGAFFGQADIIRSAFEGPSIAEFVINSKMNVVDLGRSISPLVKVLTVSTDNPYYFKEGKFVYSKSDPATIVWSDYVGGSTEVNETPGPYSFAFKGVTSVVFGEGVKQVSLCAFACNADLTTVSLSDSVEEIGESAFESCSKLISVTGGQALTKIDNRGFENCASLENIAMGNVKYVGPSAFQACPKLSISNLPDSIEYIGSCAFLGCLSVCISKLPASLNKLEYSAFENSGITVDSITVGESTQVELVGGNIFKGTAVKTVTVNKVISSDPTLIQPFYGLDIITGNDFETWKWVDGLAISLDGSTIYRFDNAVGTKLNKIEFPASVEMIYPLTGIYSGYKLSEVKLWDIDKHTVNFNLLETDDAREKNAQMLAGKIFVGSGDGELHEVYPEYDVAVSYQDSDGNELTDKTIIRAKYDSVVEAPVQTIVGYTSPELKSIRVTEVSEQNVIVYIYTINQYTITFDSNGGSPVEKMSQDYGSETSAPVEPTKNGFAFKGWLLDGAPYTFAKMPATDFTLVAAWEIVTYSVTYNLNEGTNADGNITAFTVETDAFTLLDPTRAGYRFDGWFTNAGLTGDAVETVAGGTYGDIVLYAGWAINQYTITFDTAGGSGIEAITQDYNTPVTAPADPIRAGYIFTGWDAKVPAKMPLDGMTITAVWAIVASVDENGKSVVALDSETSSFIPAAETKEITVEVRENTAVKVENASDLIGKTVVSKVEPVSNSSGVSGTAYEFTFTADGTPYNGKIQVTLPYIKEDGKEPVVYYWNGSESMKMNVVSSTETSVTFETDHNSMYVVASETPSKDDGASFMLYFGILMIAGICIAMLVGLNSYRKRA